MINFRFHIVSLTAVLLALGVGLVLGTSFLDEAVAEVLRGQLNDLEDSLERSRQHSDDLEAQVTSFEAEEQALDEELDQHLLPGALAGQPVLVIASEGIDDDLTPRTLDALTEANAQTLGVWKLSGDLALDSDDKVERLAEALDLGIDDAERLRPELVLRLSNVLWEMTDASESADPEVSGLIGPQIPQQPVDEGGEGSTEPREHLVIAALREAGLLDYELPQDSPADVVLVPPSGVRVVILTGPDADVPDGLLFDILGSLAADGRVPVVVPSTRLDPQDAPEGEEPPQTFVQAIRQNEALSSRVSTVDNFDRPAGKAATILALQAAAPGDPLIGHYGREEGADTLLPPAATPQ